MTERIGLPDAAKILGVSPQAVREHMKRGLWDLGIVEETGGRKRKYTYIIFRQKLEKLIGKE